MKKFEPSEDRLAIKAALEKWEIGEYLSYNRINSESGVVMDNRGKALLRSVLNSAKINYRCEAGQGIELEAPFNANHIVANKAERWKNATKKVYKTAKNLHDKFIDQMEQDEADRLRVGYSIFGAALEYSRQMQRYAKKPIEINQAPKPSIKAPKFDK